VQPAPPSGASPARRSSCATLRHSPDQEEHPACRPCLYSPASLLLGLARPCCSATAGLSWQPSQSRANRPELRSGSGRHMLAVQGSSAVRALRAPPCRAWATRLDAQCTRHPLWPCVPCRWGCSERCVRRSIIIFMLCCQHVGVRACLLTPIRMRRRACEEQVCAQASAAASALRRAGVQRSGGVPGGAAGAPG
jgi:hypothetical protein